MAVRREQAQQPSRNVLHWVHMRELAPMRPRGGRLHVRQQSLNKSMLVYDGQIEPQEQLCQGCMGMSGMHMTAVNEVAQTCKHEVLHYTHKWGEHSVDCIISMAICH